MHVGTCTIKIKLNFPTALESPQTTLWWGQDPKDLDKPMQA